MTVGQPIKKLVKSLAHAWLWAILWIRLCGRNGGEDCAHFSDAKVLTIAIGEIKLQDKPENPFDSAPDRAWRIAAILLVAG